MNPCISLHTIAGKARRALATAAALMLAGSAFSSLAFEGNLYWQQRVSLFDSLPVRKGDVVMLGNSITDGAEWSEMVPGVRILNRGISADVIDGVKARLRQVTSPSPAKIFLLIGINDVSHALSADTLERKYRSLVADITALAPSTRLYIQSVMPIDNSFGRYKNLKGTEPVIRELNRRLRALADDFGAQYIDLWPALADSDGKLRSGLTNDGLHLTGEGYRAWLEVIRPYITQDSQIK